MREQNDDRVASDFNQSQTSFSEPTRVIDECVARQNADESRDVDIEEVSERFTEDIRQGKKPTVEQYAALYPEIAEEIIELFPALLVLEKGSERESLSNYSEYATSRGVDPKKVDRLKNYIIRREIGRGGMGVVYEAYDETLERTVALKVMKVFRGDEEQTILRFQREAKMAAKLHHTNIVPVFGYDAVDDQFFYAMQLIEGVSLAHFLRVKEKEASRSFDELSRASRKSRRRCNSKRKMNFDDSDREIDERNDPKTIRVRVDEFVDSVFPLDASSTPILNKETQRQNDTENVAKVDSELETTVLSVPPEQTSVDKSVDAPKSQRKPTKEREKKRARLLASSKMSEGLPTSDKGLLSVHIASSNYYQRICDVGIQAAHALEYAHRHNVLHRDVKPSNLIVDYDGVVWITDFGLAKPIDETSLTRQGQLVGTLRYLAPEAVEGDFSQLSDVYSLGLTLYELLTFTPAFDESNQTKLLAQVVKGEVVRPRNINPYIPFDLETIVLKAIEPLKEKRYASAGELADDLQRFLDERPIRARRISATERLWRLCKRNKIVASLTLALVMLTLATIVFLGANNVAMKRLVAEKAQESARAENNLDLALSAFDQLFGILGNDLEQDSNFIDNIDLITTPVAGFSISERDAKALESLLAFYDEFASQNEEVPNLILKSAEANVKIGSLQRFLGRARNSDAYEKALAFYERYLARDLEEAERERVILEKSRLIITLLEYVPNEKRFFELNKSANRALDELESIPDYSPLTDAKESIDAQLRFARALGRLLILQRANVTTSFFLPEPELQTDRYTAEGLESDFAVIQKRLLKIERSGEPLTAERLRLFVKFYITYAFWKGRTGDVEAAYEQIKQSARFLDIFYKNYPNDARANLSHVMLLFVQRATCFQRMMQNANDKDKIEEYENVGAETLNTLDELTQMFPNVPSYKKWRVVSLYYAAKDEALRNNQEAAETYLNDSYEAMNEFSREYPDYEDFSFYAPLQEAFVELRVREKRFEEAQERLVSLVQYFEEINDKRSRNYPNYDLETRKAEQKKRVERLQKLLDDTRKSDDDF